MGIITNYALDVEKNFRELRESAKKLNQEKKINLEHLESYKGSSGYDEKVKEIEREYDKNLKELQNKYYKSTDADFYFMTKKVENRPIEEISDSHYKLIESYQKYRPTQEDIDRLYNLIKSNDLSVKLLCEIAQKNGLKKPKHTNKISNAELMQGISSLREYMRDVCRLPEYGNRQRYLQSSAYGGEGRNITFFRVDHDYQEGSIGFFKKDCGIDRAQDFISFFER